MTSNFPLDDNEAAASQGSVGLRPLAHASDRLKAVSLPKGGRELFHISAKRSLAQRAL